MYREILVPIDIAHQSSWEIALPQAIELAEANGGRITVITVIRDIAMMFEGVYLQFQLELLLSKAQQKLRHIIAGYQTSVSIKTEVLFGNIRREILDQAKALSADLIVMTSHRPEMKDYLIGPNTAHVAYHADCSVLVVRPRVTAGEPRE